MGLLGKLFGSKGKEAEASTAVIDCPHAVLVPRWESVQDMGREDKITRYMCEACHEEFAPDVAMKLRDTINERMEATWQAQAAQDKTSS
jgi:hypothetical protein